MQLSDYFTVAGVVIAIWAIFEARRANKLAKSTADQERRNLLRAALVPAHEYSIKLLELSQTYVLNKGMDRPLSEARQVVATQQDVYLNGAATERLGVLLGALQGTIDAFNGARYWQNVLGYTPSVTYKPEEGSIAERNKARAAEVSAKCEQAKASYVAQIEALVPALEQELASLLQEDRNHATKWKWKKRRTQTK